MDSVKKQQSPEQKCYISKHKQKFVCGKYFNLATYNSCSVQWKGRSFMQQCDKPSVMKDGKVLME